MEEYRPRPYWSDRLAQIGGLRATGHASYSEVYNKWMYRRKGQVLRRLLPVDPGDTLDIGAGVGWVVQKLHALNARSIKACDISSAAVETLLSRFPRHQFFVCAIGEDRLPLTDASLDTITMLDVAYHVVDPELWPAGLREIRRTLKPGGHLIVTDTFDVDHHPNLHVRFRSLATWEAELSKLGMKLDRMEPLYRWLSREVDESWLRRLPMSVRAPVELLLEQLLPHPPHMQMARFLVPER